MLVAVTEKLKVPVAVGVPEMMNERPSEDEVAFIPAGTAPAVTAKVNVSVAFAVSVALITAGAGYATFICASLNAPPTELSVTLELGVEVGVEVGAVKVFVIVHVVVAFELTVRLLQSLPVMV